MNKIISISLIKSLCELMKCCDSLAIVSTIVSSYATVSDWIFYRIFLKNCPLQL